MGRHQGTTAALAVLIAAGAVACSAADDGDAGFDGEAPTATVRASEAGDDRDGGVRDGGVRGGAGATIDDMADESSDDMADGPARESVDATAAPAGGVSGGIAAPGQVDTAARALAIEAGVRIGTPDVRRAADDTLAAVRRNGATVHTADVRIGEEGDDGTVDGGGFFRVLVAPERLDALITDLDASVGPVTGRTQNTADVTDQLVDLDIRISVERDAIERFQTLLRDATEFDDVVAIQRVISERTISLEQLLASQRNLENRVADSTLTIELFFVPPATDGDPVVADGDGIGDAFASGWDAFVGAAFAIGFVLAVSAPFVLSALAVLVAVWLVGRRFTRRAPGAAAADAAEPSTRPDSRPVSRDEELAAPSREG